MKKLIKNKRKKNRQKLIAVGAGGVGAIALGGIAYKMLKKKKIVNSSNSINTKTPKPTFLPPGRKLSPSSRRDRGFAKLTAKQKNRLENNYGYDFENRRFKKKVSKSAKRKGVKILKSLGEFKRRDRIINFLDKF